MNSITCRMHRSQFTFGRTTCSGNVVQSVRLIDAQGHEVPLAMNVRSPWQTADVALLDFEDGTAD
jgi:hypothetical protein